MRFWILKKIRFVVASLQANFNFGNLLQLRYLDVAAIHPNGADLNAFAAEFVDSSTGAVVSFISANNLGEATKNGRLELVAMSACG